MAKLRVTLTDEERCGLRNMVSSGQGAARTLLHGRILLQAEASPAGMRYADEAIAEALGGSLSTIHRVRQQFVEDSFEAAPIRGRPRKRPDKVTITGEGEQQRIALACGEPPRGHGRWTVRLLAARLVELGYVVPASRETIRQALKKLRVAKFTGVTAPQASRERLPEPCESAAAAYAVGGGSPELDVALARPGPCQVPGLHS